MSDRFETLKEQLLAALMEGGDMEKCPHKAEARLVLEFMFEQLQAMKDPVLNRLSLPIARSCLPRGRAPIFPAIYATDLLRFCETRLARFRRIAQDPIFGDRTDPEADFMTFTADEFLAGPQSILTK